MDATTKLNTVKSMVKWFNRADIGDTPRVEFVSFDDLVRAMFN